MGQVGSISLGDPSLREGHLCCYFQLLQVGPGLLPPPVDHSCPDLVACRISYDVKHLLGMGGGQHPMLSPSPLFQEAAGNPKAYPPPSGPRATQRNPVPGFSEHFLVPPFQWVAVKIALGLS